MGKKKLKALKEVRLWASIVALDLKPTPGGNAYTYEGSSNNVEELKEALETYEALRFFKGARNGGHVKVSELVDVCASLPDVSDRIVASSGELPPPPDSAWQPPAEEEPVNKGCEWRKEDPLVRFDEKTTQHFAPRSTSAFDGSSHFGYGLRRIGGIIPTVFPPSDVRVIVLRVEKAWDQSCAYRLLNVRRCDFTPHAWHPITKSIVDQAKLEEMEAFMHHIFSGRRGLKHKTDGGCVSYQVDVSYCLRRNPPAKLTREEYYCIFAEGGPLDPNDY